MRLFADTSDPAVIKDLHYRGIISGVTTNPTTASKYINENRRAIKTIRDLAYTIFDAVGPIPVSIETVGCEPPDYSWQDMQSLDWRKWAPIEDRIYSESVRIMEWSDELGAEFWQKVPAIPAGVRAMARLVYDYPEKAKINATLGFDYKQGVRAAEAGAYVFSLFMGRMQAAGEDPIPVAKRIIDEYTEREFRTGFLAASMRTPELILDSWRAGADIATAPPDVLEQLARKYPKEFGEIVSRHPKKGRLLVPMVSPVMYFTDEFSHPLLAPGLDRFVSDAASAGYNLLESAKEVKV
ncbi:MAG: hypothetical protein HY515_04090 [Candidatus Aenigmarchaeota archaeon]|nr:hypothetical protein [Candidatus Aenigmarchaeota archaeon]